MGQIDEALEGIRLTMQLAPWLQNFGACVATGFYFPL